MHLKIIIYRYLFSIEFLLNALIYNIINDLNILIVVMFDFNIQKNNRWFYRVSVTLLLDNSIYIRF